MEPMGGLCPEPPNANQSTLHSTLTDAESIACNLGWSLEGRVQQLLATLRGPSWKIPTRTKLEDLEPQGLPARSMSPILAPFRKRIHCTKVATTLDLTKREQPVQHSRARPILLAFAARPAFKLVIGHSIKM